jgi:hypothetical protein
MMPVPRFVTVHAEGSQRRQFQQRGARIEQHLDAIAGQQFAPPDVLGAGGIAAAETCLGLSRAQFLHQRPRGGLAGGEFGTFPIDFGFEHRHDCRTIVQPVI